VRRRLAPRLAHYTFDGFNVAQAFLDLLVEVGVERIMFSVDYPYVSMQEARDFLRHLPVSETDRAHRARQCRTPHETLRAALV
jgi:predicted TIM-barrel fold metal-dependent hydrolase